MTRYDVNITRKALKEPNKLDPHSRDRILEALTILRDYGFTGRLDIKKLHGYKDHYRIRVEKCRILYSLSRETA